MATASYFHVDVFAAGPLSGNGLSVFLGTDSWSAGAMQRLTQEMKQFESIFLSNIGPTGAAARVFTVEEELPFAGHPVLGAAVVLHRALTPDAPSCEWTLQLAHGPIAVRTERRDGHWRAEMNQGQAVHEATVGMAELQPILERLSLTAEDLAPGLPARVVSTGLPYLIVPVRPEALARTSIQGHDLEERLATRRWPAPRSRATTSRSGSPRWARSSFSSSTPRTVSYGPGTTWAGWKTWPPAAPPARPPPTCLPKAWPTAPCRSNWHKAASPAVPAASKFSAAAMARYWFAVRCGRSAKARWSWTLPSCAVSRRSGQNASSSSARW
jgi:predicted PhzF superfamily epimerase YddE/YHI9